MHLKNERVPPRGDKTCFCHDIFVFIAGAKTISKCCRKTTKNKTKSPGKTLWRHLVLPAIGTRANGVYMESGSALVRVIL